MRSGLAFSARRGGEGAAPVVWGTKRWLRLSLSSGQTLNVDAVLVAAGRKSAVATLNLGAAGVAAGERGVIAVDAFTGLTFFTFAPLAM